MKKIEMLSQQEIEEMNDIMRKKYNRVLLKRGIGEWTIDGITVLALNRKNAERKVRTAISQKV